MNAQSAIFGETRPRWRRRLSIVRRRTGFVPLIEVATIALLLVTVTTSFFVFRGGALLTPAMAAVLLVANLEIGRAHV